MKKSTWAFIIVAIAAAIVAWWSYKPGTTVAPTAPVTFDLSISDGTITMRYPGADFGLAMDQQQLLVKSYIPACDPDFNYCLYYTGTAYKGTNFDSAGIRIQKRADLTTERLCLSTPPAGFDSTVKPTATSSADLYSASTFANVGGGAAGHIAGGSLYRLFIRSAPTCYEFETRIGQSQFANYPSGTIQKFTDLDQATLRSEIHQIVASLTVPSGATVSFP